MESKICAAVSNNLETWEDLGVILKPTFNDAWDSGRLFAGSTYKLDGTYYLFYSGAGAGTEFQNEAIGLATSKDGINWQRISNKPLLKPDENNCWYGRYGSSFQWRDPYVIKHPETGLYYMFITANAREENSNHYYGGCIGLAVADKISGPYTILPPAARPLVEGSDESPFYEMERPQVIYQNGQYHLFFSAFVKALNPIWLTQIGTQGITDSTVYWFVSSSITGPFKPISSKPFLKGSERTGLYGTYFFPLPHQSDIYFAYGWRHRLFMLNIDFVYQMNWQNQSLENKSRKVTGYN
jgi:beta-fructofuranosidase